MRHTFDEGTRGGFEGHITREHNPLHYIFFLRRLRNHEAEDYTGVESSVRNIMDNASETLTAKVSGGWYPFWRESVAAQRVLPGSPFDFL